MSPAGSPVSRRPTSDVSADADEEVPVLGSGFRDGREHTAPPPREPRSKTGLGDSHDDSGPSGARLRGPSPMSGSEPQSVETVIDNGVHGKRTIRFETGHLARQAAGSAVAYLDEETMLL